MLSTGGLQKANRFSIQVFLKDQAEASSRKPLLNHLKGHVFLIFDDDTFDLGETTLVNLGQCLYQWSVNNSIVSPKNLIPLGSILPCPFGFIWNYQERSYAVFQWKNHTTPLRKIGFFDALIAAKICIEELCLLVKEKRLGDLRPLVEALR